MSTSRLFRNAGTEDPDRFDQGYVDVDIMIEQYDNSLSDLTLDQNSG